MKHSINEDALAVWQALQEAAMLQTGNGRPVRWVIYGHSMGSAVAVALAARLNGEACVLRFGAGEFVHQFFRCGL